MSHRLIDDEFRFDAFIQDERELGSLLASLHENFEITENSIIQIGGTRKPTQSARVLFVACFFLFRLTVCM